MSASEKLRPNFQKVDDILIPPFFSKELFQSAMLFRPLPGEVFVATYPKCGTTWMQNVILGVHRRGQALDQPRDFFLASPFLDQLGAEESRERMIRPGAYKTHLLFHKVPWSEDCKYIYVARNPKDCSVSFWHHMRQIPGYQFSAASFDDFLNLFLEGDLEYGDYFDHLLSWYGQRSRPNVLFTTYETMQRDLRGVVLEVAEFLGASRDLEVEPAVLEKILHDCRFENMAFVNEAINDFYRDPESLLGDPSLPRGRKHIVEYIAKLPRRTHEDIRFVRKGKTGDWRTTFTEKQERRMDRRIREKTRGSDVMQLWDGLV